MAEWFCIYETATGQEVSFTTSVGQLPVGQSSVSIGTYTSHPFESGLMWDQATQSMIARPTPVYVSRVAWDIQNNPDPVFVEYNAAVDDVNAGPKRARIRTAVRAMVRYFLGIERRRRDFEDARLFPDDAEPD